MEDLTEEDIFSGLTSEHLHDSEIVISVSGTNDFFSLREQKVPMASKIKIKSGDEPFLTVASSTWAPCRVTLFLCSRLITPQFRSRKKQCLRAGGPLRVSHSLLHCVPYSDHVCYLRRLRNIWTCSEGCNFRRFPTLLIPQYVYFDPVFWSLARFLRSNHQVTEADGVYEFLQSGMRSGAGSYICREAYFQATSWTGNFFFWRFFGFYLCFLFILSTKLR